MKLRTLFIGPEEQAAIDAVRAYGEAHPYSLRDILELLGGHGPVPGNDPKRVVHLPIGFRVVYTVEQQLAGWCDHFSVSIDNAAPGKLPGIETVKFICRAFGKPQEWKQVWVEKISEQYPGEADAVNIIMLKEEKTNEPERRQSDTGCEREQTASE